MVGMKGHKNVGGKFVALLVTIPNERMFLQVTVLKLFMPPVLMPIKY